MKNTKQKVYKLDAKTKRKLDRLFSQFIHKRDKVCMVCGKKDFLDTAHIIPRTCLALRWAPQNAILLCKRHHKFGGVESFHSSPFWFYRWYSEHYGEDHITKLLKASEVEVTFSAEDVEEIEEMLKLSTKA